MQLAQASRQLQAAADANAARGSLVFHLDLATELARAALEDLGVAAADLIALADEQGYRVLGLDDAASPDLVVTITFSADGTAMPVATRGAPPFPASALARARRTAAMLFPTSTIIVLPPPHGEYGLSLEAYAVTRAPPGRIALGQHWRVVLSPGGDAVRDRAAFSDQPQTVPMQSDLSLRQRGFVPDEICTYLSLKHSITFDVLTTGSGLHWRIDGERTRMGLRSTR